MTNNSNSIREAKIEKDANENITRVTIAFGPHYYIEIQPDENGILTLYMGATHHGFMAPANDIGMGLEAIIDEIRKNHPELMTD